MRRLHRDGRQSPARRAGGLSAHPRRRRQRRREQRGIPSVPVADPPRRAPRADRGRCQGGQREHLRQRPRPRLRHDLLPLALAGTCQSIEQIRCMEIVDYATYDSATVMFDVMGFGKPLDELPLLLQPGVLSLAWGSVVRQLAAGLGIELDEVSETYIREPAPEDFEIAAGHIPKGSAAALRFEVRGMTGGKPAVVLEHVTCLRDDLRPDWP